VYKIFISIIASGSQAALQPGRGTIELIIALEQIIEKSIVFNNPVYSIYQLHYSI